MAQRRYPWPKELGTMEIDFEFKERQFSCEPTWNVIHHPPEEDNDEKINTNR